MATAAHCLANQANAQLSTGPRTGQGQARSSQDAFQSVRHAANAIVLKQEDLEAFEELAANYVEVIQPGDAVEHHLTNELAALDWLFTRVYAFDTRLLDYEMNLQAPALGSAGLTVQELTRLTVAGRSIVDRSNYPNNLVRRAAQLIRTCQSTLAFLKDLRRISTCPSFPRKSFPPNHLPPNPPSGTNPIRTRRVGRCSSTARGLKAPPVIPTPPLPHTVPCPVLEFAVGLVVGRLSRARLCGCAVGHADGSAG